MPPGTDGAEAGTAVAGRTPCEKACCMDGIAASGETEVVLGTSAAVKGESH